MDKKDFWDTGQPGTGPLLTPQLLSYAEELMDFKLPPLAIDLLKIKNGGKTNDLAFPINRNTCLGDKYLPIDEFYGIIDQSLAVKPNILHSAYLSQEWNLPEKQFLLTGDGYWWIALNYRDSDVPSVNWLEVDSQRDFILANTFEDFVNGLEPLVKYQPAEINSRVVGNTVIWENFIAEEKLIELDEKFWQK